MGKKIVIIGGGISGLAAVSGQQVAQSLIQWLPHQLGASASSIYQASGASADSPL